jgi:hypothetical protein
VVWHEQVFFEKNQAQIGALLGKSSDWVSVRSRIHKLPDGLEERLRQRPRVIAQMLELGSFYAQQRDVALALADRVVGENLTLDAIRGIVRGYARPEKREGSQVGAAKRRGIATKVLEITNQLEQRSEVSAGDKNHERRGAATDEQLEPDAPAMPLQARGRIDPSDAASAREGISSLASRLTPCPDGTLLQEAADTLTLLASRADQLPVEAISELVLDQMETALKELRRSFTHRTAMHTV